MSLGISQLLLIVIFLLCTQAVRFRNGACGPNCTLRLGLKHMGMEMKFLQDSCKCEGSNCRCCFQGSWPQFNISQELCMNGAFVSEDFELQVNATLNGNTLGNFKLSGRNPPPLCFPVPFPVPIPLEMCIRAKDVYPMGTNMHFCVDMMMRFAGFDFLTIPLNCMLIGADGVQLVDQK